MDLMLGMVMALSRPGLTFSNGNFATTDRWTATGSWVIDTALGVAKVNANPTLNSSLHQDCNFRTNRSYTVTFTIQNWVSGDVRCYITDKHAASPYLHANGTYTYTVNVTHPAADTRIYFQFDNGWNCNFEITNISVKYAT